MRLIDIVTGPWAITPEMLVEIQNIYCIHLRGPKISESYVKAVEEKNGQPLENKQLPYEVNTQGVAVINAIGVIGKRMNLMTRISGGVSTEMLGKDILQALDDPNVKSIILNVDSPGGTVDGTQELANMIYDNRDRKPIVTFSDGMIASAAYWIASATDKVFISGDTNFIGSIGVVARHVDVSKLEEKAGIKTTEITAGKYKRISSEYEPLSKDGQADIQSKVDYIYSVMVTDIAKFRGVPVETVLKDMADGKIFIGNQAIDADLVDGKMSMVSLIEMMGKTPARSLFTAMKDEFTAGPNLSHDSKLASREPSWANVDKTKLPRSAFAGQGDAGKKSTWSYPHHFVQNGKVGPDGVYVSGTMYLHRGGLNAAWSAAQGARSGKKASPDIIAHIRRHRDAIGEGKKENAIKQDLQDGGIPSAQIKTINHKNKENEMDINELTLEMLADERPDLVKEIQSGAEVKKMIATAVSKAEKDRDATIGKMITDATTGILANAKKEAMEALTAEDIQKHPKFHEAAKVYVGNLGADKLEEFPQVIKAAKDAAAVSTEFMNKIIASLGSATHTPKNGGDKADVTGLFKKAR